MEELKLSRLEARLDDLTYPLSLAEARAELGNVVLRYADGSEPLDDVLSRSNAERFESRDDLVLEVYNNLPTEAVGEPGQAEGEG